MTSALNYLLVDDDPFVLSSLELICRSKGHSVRSVCTVADAFAEVAREVPHVIVSDLDLPEGSGAELLFAVAQKHPHVRRILFSGSSSSATEDLVARGIAHAFVPKGSPSAALFDAVDDAIEKRSTELLAEAALASGRVVQLLSSLAVVVREAQGFLSSATQPFIEGKLLDWAQLRLDAASHLGFAADALQLVLAELSSVQVERCVNCGGKGCKECYELGEVLRILSKEAQL